MPITSEIERERIKCWLTANGLGTLEIQRLPDTGFVNRVYRIGEEFILRIAKDNGDESDCYTERVAVPVACEAGVRTPKLLLFDESREIFDSVATFYELAAGVTLGCQRIEQSALPNLYREIGDQLGILHKNVTRCDDPMEWLDKPELFDARTLLDEARTKMKVEAVSYDWLAKWLDRLEPSLSEVPEPRFLHNDLHSFNTMVFPEPLKLSAILDWGDAGWGDPAIEFGTMPIWAVDWMLDGYHAAKPAVDELLCGRLLWHDIGAALEASINQWVETSQPWQPLTSSRWINLIRHMGNRESPRWRRWLPDSSI